MILSQTAGDKPVTLMMTAALLLAEGDCAPNTPPKNRSGWVFNKRVDCPVYLGFWICTVCIRSGRDFRKDFCPYKNNRTMGGRGWEP